jgi:hypothetical protein
VLSRNIGSFLQTSTSLSWQILSEFTYYLDYISSLGSSSIHSYCDDVNCFEISVVLKTSSVHGIFVLSLSEG